MCVVDGDGERAASEGRRGRSARPASSSSTDSAGGAPAREQRSRGGAPASQEARTLICNAPVVVRSREEHGQGRQDMRRIEGRNRARRGEAEDPRIAFPRSSSRSSLRRALSPPLSSLRSLSVRLREPSGLALRHLRIAALLLTRLRLPWMPFHAPRVGTFHASLLGPSV